MIGRVVQPDRPVAGAQVEVQNPQVVDALGVARAVGDRLAIGAEGHRVLDPAVHRIGEPDILQRRGAEPSQHPIA